MERVERNPDRQEQIEVRRLSLPLTTPYHLSFGDVHAFDTVLVRLHDADGREGLLYVNPPRDVRFGLRLGQRFTPAHLGLLGYVLQSCGTVGAALERLQHYERLINGINRLRRREVTDDHGLPCTDLVWGVEHGRPGPQVDSCNIATLLQVTRRMTGLDAGPLRIDFVNPAPADLAPYSAFFSCPLHFDQPETRVRLPSAWLDVPLPKDGKAIEDYGNRIFRHPGFVRSLTDQEKKLRDLPG